MGLIVDRTKERLVPADSGIIKARQKLRKAAIALRDQGVIPPGVDPAHHHALGGHRAPAGRGVPRRRPRRRPPSRACRWPRSEMTVDTSLSSCARAASAAEARFRIDAPVESRRARVIALDEPAAAVLRSVAALEWASARFFVCDTVGDGDADDVLLRGIDGSPAVLSGELAARTSSSWSRPRTPGPTAHAIGKACWERRSRPPDWCSATGRGPSAPWRRSGRTRACCCPRPTRATWSNC